MTNNDLIQVAKAIQTLSNYLEMTDNDIVARIALFDKNVFAKLNTAARVYNDFLDSSIENRARMLGWNVVETEN